MRIKIEIEMPDDFLVATLTDAQRNEALARRFQNALDREYPYARMGTVAIVELSSERDS